MSLSIVKKRKALFLQPNLKTFFALGLLIGVVLLITYWEFYGREQLLYQEVLVFKEAVSKNTIVEEGMLKVIKQERDSVNHRAVIDISQIVGLEAKQYIPENSILVEEYFEISTLIPKENESILAIPQSWILSSPGTLRRGDEIKIYTMDKEGGAERELLLDGIRVAYVKDSAGREVTDDVYQSLPQLEERLYATGNITTVEVIITLNHLKDLTSALKNNKGLIILY